MKRLTATRHPMIYQIVIVIQYQTRPLENINRLNILIMATCQNNQEHYYAETLEYLFHSKIKHQTFQNPHSTPSSFQMNSQLTML